VSLLSQFPDGPVAKCIVEYLTQRGYYVHIIGLRDHSVSKRQDIISILDLERSKPFLVDISPEEYRRFQSMILGLQENNDGCSGFLWLTRSSQVGCLEPGYAEILGLARTLRNELALDFGTVELDADLKAVSEARRLEALDATFNVFRKFQSRLSRKLTSGADASDGAVHPDYEYAIVDGTVCIPRYHWFSVKDSLSDSSGSETETNTVVPIGLQIGKRGSLKSLQWTALSPNPEDLRGNEVVVEARAVGMNFKVRFHIAPIPVSKR
jgi:hypothetical protein